jgi:hypothetical protein
VRNGIMTNLLCVQARRDEGWTRTDAGKGDDDDDGGADASDYFKIILFTASSAKSWARAPAVERAS